MADSFNPYVEWLGLPANLAEPNHYQLLGLADFEGDEARIAIAADRAMSKVRSFRPGPNAKAWSRLLDEILLAKAHLTDPDRKSEYDAELREQGNSSGADSGPTLKADAPVRTGPDPRFPPGMGPNEGRSSAAKQAKPEDPAPSKAEQPAPAPNPAPLAPLAPMNAPAAAPIAAPVWPDSMLHPHAHGPHPAQHAQPAQHVQQPAPLAQPMYGAPQAQSPYGQMPQGPAPHAQNPYQQAPIAYPGTLPAYGMQPGYPQPAPYGQPPMAQAAYTHPQYGAPQYAQPVQQPAPYGMPAYGAAPYAPPAPPMEPPPAMPYSAPSAYAGSFGTTGYSSFSTGDPLASLPPSMPLDPMAPVALPAALPGADDGKQGRVVGFAGASPAAIPKGKAVAPPPAPTGAPEPTRNSLTDAVSVAPRLPAGVNTVAPSDLVTVSEATRAEKNLLYGMMGAVVLIGAAIVFAVAYNNRGNNPEVANNPTSAPDTKPLPRVEPPTPIIPPPKPAVTPPKPVEPMPTRPMPAQPMTPVKPPMGDPFDDPMPMPPMTTNRPSTDSPSPVKPPDPMPEPLKPEPPKPEPPKPEPPKPEPPKPEPPKPEPMPEVKLTPVELASLSKAMTTARDALSERNFEEFEKQFAAARQLAKSANQLAKVDRLMMLGEYVKQFDRQLKSLLADENFDAGAELVIGKSTRVVVVERNPSMIIIRINGMNKTYSLANLPDGLAMALIDKRLDQSDPARHVVKGAYFAAAKVQTEETKQKAKDLWEQAAREGVPVGDLALVLTDSYEFKE